MHLDTLLDISLYFEKLFLFVTLLYEYPNFWYYQRLTYSDYYF